MVRSSTKKLKRSKRRVSVNKSNQSVKGECEGYKRTEKKPTLSDIEFKAGKCYYYDEGGNEHIYQDFYKGLKKKYGKDSYDPVTYKINFKLLKSL